MRCLEDAVFVKLRLSKDQNVRGVGGMPLKEEKNQMMRVLQCPNCSCERTTKELFPPLEIQHISHDPDNSWKKGDVAFIPDSSEIPLNGKIWTECPECGETDWWDDTNLNKKIKGENEMTNWNDYDKAKAEEKSYVTFPENADVFVGLRQGTVKCKKFVDGKSTEIEKESGVIEVLKEGDVKQEDLIGKAQFWALTDFYGLAENDVKPDEKEFSTLSNGLIEELRLLDDQDKLYSHIIKIRRIPGQTKYQTKYRAEAIRPKPTEGQ